MSSLILGFSCQLMVCACCVASVIMLAKEDFLLLGVAHTSMTAFKHHIARSQSTAQLDLALTPGVTDHYQIMISDS